MYMKIFKNNKVFKNNFSQNSLKESCKFVEEHIFGNNQSIEI